MQEQKSEMKPEYIDYQGKMSVPLRNRVQVTPDFQKLKMFPYIPILLYGKFQRNGVYDYVVKNCPYMGVGHTVSPSYEMRKCSENLETFVLKKSFVDRHKYTIFGEVYAVNVETLHVLDNILSRGIKFERERVAVLLDQIEIKDAPRSFGFPRIDSCFMYIGRPAYWDAFESTAYLSTRLKTADKRYEGLQFQQHTPLHPGGSVFAQRHRSPHHGITDQYDKELKGKNDIEDWLKDYMEQKDRADKYDREAERNRDLVDLMAEHPYGGVDSH